jgi:prepilin peptidase CpaA
MLILLVYLSAVFVALAVFVLAAVSDFKTFTIPNSYSVIMIVSFIMAYGMITQFAPTVELFESFISHLIAFGAVFLVTLVLYALKLLGAGDSKFMASIGLWIGIQGLMPFLFYMSLMGGVLAGITLYLRKNPKLKNMPEGSWFDVAQNGDQRLPYGIAISIGAVIAFVANGYVNPSLWIEIINQ